MDTFLLILLPIDPKDEQFSGIPRGKCGFVRYTSWTLLVYTKYPRLRKHNSNAIIALMANYKGHIAGGVTAGVTLVLTAPFIPIEQFAESAHLLQDWQALAGVIIVAIVFALFPDVDTNSKAQDIFYGILLPINILLIWQNHLQAAAYLGLIAMLPIIGHHRGWTHSYWAMLIVPLPILVVPWLYHDHIVPISAVYYAAAVGGYFSHLLLDGQIVKWIRVKG